MADQFALLLTELSQIRLISRPLEPTRVDAGPWRVDPPEWLDWKDE
jgi:hypothetical protein